METEKDVCPIINVDGFIEKGKQFDLEIVVPEDDRNVIYGVLKNRHGDPIKDAVVKLIEVSFEYGKKEKRPVSHTFTDKDGEFVFGPLCPDRSYEIQIWVDKVKHVKICKECSIEKKNCLKGLKVDSCNKEDDFKPDFSHPCKK